MTAPSKAKHILLQRYQISRESVKRALKNLERCRHNCERTPVLRLFSAQKPRKSRSETARGRTCLAFMPIHRIITATGGRYCIRTGTEYASLPFSRPCARRFVKRPLPLQPLRRPMQYPFTYCERKAGLRVRADRATACRATSRLCLNCAENSPVLKWRALCK